MELSLSSPSWLFLAIGLLGLFLDVISAIIIILPDIPYLNNISHDIPCLRRYYTRYEEIINARQTFHENQQITSSHEGFNQLSSLFMDKYDSESRVSIINKRPEQGTVEILRESADTIAIPEYELNLWIKEEITNRKRKFERIYLILGVVGLFIGFVLQFISYLIRNFNINI